MKKIKIGNRVWTIRLVLEKEIGGCHYGITDYKTQNILINSEFKKDSRIESLFHELVHVFTESNRGSSDDHKNKIDRELNCNLIGIGLAKLSHSKQLSDVISWLEND